MSSGLEARASDPECRQEMRFRWVWDVDAMTVSIEFLSCREGETGATRTNSGEERWLENQREQNTRRGVVPLQRFHCGVAPKRKWLASLAIQVNTKRRYRGCYETHADDQADVKSSHL